MEPGLLGCGGNAMLLGNEAVLALAKPILHHLAKPGVTEVAINRPKELFVETDNGWERFEEPTLDLQSLRSLASSIASYNKQTISSTEPLLSASLPGGERVQIVMDPAVPAGTFSMTIRRPDSRIKALSEYVESGMFADTGRPVLSHSDISSEEEKGLSLLQAQEIGEFLQYAVKQHLNIAIVGDTGSGKTTLMKSLCQEIEPWERIVTIEDVRELMLPNHLNQVNLLYSKGGQGMAKVEPKDLIQSCMRMKPNRVLLAELRGAESYDFLKLLTSGHSGSITSWHAENCRRAVSRFVLMAKEHPEAAAYEVSDLTNLFFTAMDVIAHVRAVPVFDDEGRQIGKKRVMTEIYFDPRRKVDLAYGTQ